MKPSLVYLGADHAGFALKEKIEKWLLKSGYCVEDLSPTLKAGDDYPRIGFAVAEAVAKEPNALGILVCGSGVGVAIAANRAKGARAVAAHSPSEAREAREHNDANILALSGWHMGAKKTESLLRPFLSTAASRAARHRRRVKQLDA